MADVGKFFGGLFGSAASSANPVSPINGVLEGASKIIGLFKLSPEVKAQLQAQLVAENIDMEKAELAASLVQVQGQLEINKQEAASTNWFVAGWRPAVGWVCVLGLFWAYFLQPFVEFAIINWHGALPPGIPHLDTGTLISGLLIPLLGLGVMRTFEKVQDAAGNH